MAHGRRGRGFAPMVVAGLTALVWGVHFLPLLAPQGRMWGFNQLLFLPPLWTLLYAVLGMVAAVFLVPQVADVTGRVYRTAAGWLLADIAQRRWLSVALFALVLFWLLRLPAHLLGDGHSVIANLNADLPIIYKWSEIGAIYLAFALSRIAALFTGGFAPVAYEMLAVFSGGVTVFLFLALACELGRTAEQRLLIFGLTICAGWVLLFFGYVENYPILWPLMTGYIYFGVRYIGGKNSLVLPAVFLFAALVMHLQVLFLVFSFLVLVVSRGTGRHFYTSHRILFWGTAGVFLFVGMAALYYLWQSSIEFRLYVIPFWEGMAGGSDYTLFSTTHLADIGNQLLLLIPLFPALAVIAWGRRRPIAFDPIDQFLILLSAGGIAFLWLIDPKLGLGRDWDLFALAGLAPVLMLGRGIIEDTSLLKARAYPAVIIAAFTLVLPFLAVNLNYESALASYRYLLSLDMPRSRTGISILHDIYIANGDQQAADSLRQVMAENFPAATLVPQAYQLMEAGDLERARGMADSLAAREPYSPEILVLRGRVALRQGEYARAIRDLDLAARLGRYDSRPLAALAEVYNRMGKTTEMMTTLRQAQRRSPTSHEVIEGLAAGFYSQRQYDSALTYARKMIAFDSVSASGLMIAGVSAFYSGDHVSARQYLSAYLRQYPSGPQTAAIKSLLQTIAR